MPAKLLIVDDNPVDRDICRRALTHHAETPYTILMAEDGRQCLDRIRNDGDVCCVVLDYTLPDRSGAEVLDEILQIDPFMPVVIVTGRNDPKIAVELLKAGAQDFQVKSWDMMGSLAKTVQRAIERAAMREQISVQKQNIEAFAHVLVHDLRSPLRTIRQAIQLLTEDMTEDCRTANSEMLDFIYQAASRMDELILDVNAYNRAGADPVTQGPLDLVQAVEEARQNLSADIDASGAEVCCDCGLPAVRGNLAELTQLFQNLIGNGIKYNRSKTPKIGIRADRNGDDWLIAVQDNGIGIEEHSLKTIFRPFERLHRQDDFEGTGLGLATCQKIAQRHGGRLYCTSQVGEGSVFTLVLPVSRDARSAA
jgi:signal transduction histidine kinase